MICTKKISLVGYFRIYIVCMIKKIFRSELDLDNLSLKRSIPVEQVGKNLDYKKKVVSKPWGYEYLMFENEYVAIWILFLKHDFATSIHCHPNKKTSLMVLSGSVMTSTLDNQFVLHEGDGLIIEKGVFHSTKGTELEGAYIMEIETPVDKNDLVRLKDNYGRENKSYEGERFMTDNTHEYEYCDFHGCEFVNSTHSREIKNVKFTIVHDEIKNIFEEVNLLANGRYCFLDNFIGIKKTKGIPLVGELFDSDNLKSIREHLSNNDKRILLVVN